MLPGGLICCGEKSDNWIIARPFIGEMKQNTKDRDKDKTEKISFKRHKNLVNI